MNLMRTKYVSIVVAFPCNHVVFLSSRGRRRSLSSCSLIHPPQLPSVRSRLVPTVPRETCFLLPSCCGTKGNPHRKWRTLEDSVWISYCQLWHFPGGWCRRIHPRGHCSGLCPPNCSPCHQPWRRRPIIVLSASKLFLLRPHAPRVALGLDPRRSSAGITAVLTRNQHWLRLHYRNIHQIIKCTEVKQNVQPSYRLYILIREYAIGKTIYFHINSDFSKLVFKQIVYNFYIVHHVKTSIQALKWPYYA